MTRDALIALPHGLDPTKGAPVLLNFHGSGSDMAEQALYSRFPTVATARGYVVVSPNGTGFPRGWQLSGDLDVRFVTDLLADLGRHMCIDPHRIFVAGISDGSAFSGLLLCHAPFRFAAAGMVAAPFPNTCPAGVVRPIIKFHGTADPVVPYSGGKVNAFGFGYAPGALANASDWATKNGCGQPVSGRAAADVLKSTWRDCPPDGNVVLYTLQGGGHTWPGPIDVSKLGITDLGGTVTSIDASQLMLDFFDSHPLP